jgi:surface protein
MRKIIILCLALLLAIGLQAQQTFGTATPVDGGTVSLDVSEVTTYVMTDNTKVTVFPVGSDQEFTVPNGVFNIEYLVVGGGGGGAYGLDRTAGGGAGGRVTEGYLEVTSGDIINISVGAGGRGGSSNAVSLPGGNSSLTYGENTFTAPGGGYGTRKNRTGTNGGGLFHPNSALGSNIPYNNNGLSGITPAYQVYWGGIGSENADPSYRFGAGGGAGDGGHGGDAYFDSGAGDGGVGHTSTITGESLGYGGGGGGSFQQWVGNPDIGDSYRGLGKDGGGHGAIYDHGVSPKESAQSGTRGGGGGGGVSDNDGGAPINATYGNGGNGGDGVVVLRYEIPNPNFYVENGTCKCPNAEVGDTGTMSVNGITGTFTKRTRAQLDTLIDLENWDEVQKTCTSGITDMSQLFFNEPSFNKNINHWDTSNVDTMSNMFNFAGSFNQPLNNWDVSNVTTMLRMFSSATSFNQNLNNWDVSKVTNMDSMFRDATSFNQPLNNWDVSKVTNMNFMFRDATSFNQPLNNWDVSSLTQTISMFMGADAFNQSLNNWDVSNLTTIRFMFSGTSNFNQPLNNWDVSNVEDMYAMFQGATAFNQDIGNWDVSGVNPWSGGMDNMFKDATSFNQDLRSWCVEIFGSEPTDFSTDSALDNANKPSWGSCGSSDNQDFVVDGIACKCPNAEVGDTATMSVNGITGTFTKRTRAQLDTLIDEENWDEVQRTCTTGITDMSQLFFNASSFNKNINHWDTSSVTNFLAMFKEADSFNQPLYNWDVSNVTNMAQLFFDSSSFNQHLNNWDVSNVTNMSELFRGAHAFNKPLYNWDVSNVTNMNYIFTEVTNFNQPINNWNVSNVTGMSNMFNGTAFNQNLSSWDVSNVTNMSQMFKDAPFNQDISSWDVSNVELMINMFYGASAFNQDIGSWDVSNVEYMLSMFYGASAFNQDLSGWCVEEIGTEPSSFSTGSGLDEANKPNWGAACDVTINLDSETLDLAQTKMNTGYDVTLTGTNANINQAMNGSGDLIINTTSLTMSESVNVANLSITTTNGTTFSGTNKTLQASGSMTLNTDMNVTGSLTLDSPSASLAKGKHIEVTGSLTNNATVLEMNSDSNEFASLRINGGSINGTGDMAYKRYVNTTPGNDLISPPFAGMTFESFITRSNGFEVLLNGSMNGTPGYFLFGPFDTVNNNYVMFNSSTDGNTTLEMGKGYRAGRMTEGFSSEAVVFETPNNYNYTSLTSNLDVQLVGSGSGWNLIGNPYPSYLNLSDVLSNNTASLFGEEFEAIYAYNGDATNPWTIYNSSSGANVKIAPGQAFFVRAAVGGSTFSFTPSMQSNTGGDDFIQGRNAAETAVYRAGIELSSSVGSYTTDVYFHPNGSNGLDVGYDAASWQGSAPDYGVYSHLVSDNQGLPIAIQTLHSDALEQDSTVIPLGVEASSGYTLTLGLTDNSYLPESAIVYLEDRNLGSFTNLRTGSYSVSSGNGISGTGRFFIHVSNDATLSNPSEVYSGVQVYSPMGSGVLVVTGVNEPGMRLRLYDIQGRLLLDQGLSAVSMQELPVGTLSTAAVIARLEGAQGSRSVKLIINQK